MRRILILLIVILPTLLVVATLLWSLGVFTKAQSVALAEVSLSSLHRSVITNGKIEAEKIYELRAPMAGICRRTEARDGMRLQQGQAILRIEEPSLPAQMAAAQAELDAAHLDLRDIQRGPTQEELNQADAASTRARLAVDNTRKLLEANEWLLARNAISRFEVEQNRRSLAEAEQALSASLRHLEDLKKRFGDLDLRRARSRMEAAQARIKLLQENEARQIVRAPVNGTLYQFDVKDGAYLNIGDPIGLLADLTKLRLKAYVDEPDIGQVAVGEQVLVRWDAHPQDQWQGVVVHLPPQVVALGTRSVAEVLCSIENPKGTLMSNINVDVEIEAPEEPAVDSLPRAVVLPEGKKEFVWVISDGKAAKRYVETGRSTSTRIEITRGLTLGEKVIDPVDDLISEGLKVQARTK
jgi:HlyD family secretion protein